MVSVTELEKDLRLDVALIKSLAGGDVICARGLHKDPIEFEPQFLIWIATNHRPQLPDDDDAVWRRIQEIPFEVQIPEAERNPRVREDLRNPDLHGPAILNWMIEGLRLLREEGFDPPKAIRTATEEYRQEMDPLRDFIDDCCVVDSEFWLPSSALRDEYEGWCRERGQRPVASTEFSQRLRSRGCIPQQCKMAGKSTRGWRGIRIRS